MEIIVLDESNEEVQASVRDIQDELRQANPRYRLDLMGGMNHQLITRIIASSSNMRKRGRWANSSACAFMRFKTEVSSLVENLIVTMILEAQGSQDRIASSSRDVGALCKIRHSSLSTNFRKCAAPRWRSCEGTLLRQNSQKAKGCDKITKIDWNTHLHWSLPLERCLNTRSVDTLRLFESDLP